MKSLLMVYKATGFATRMTVAFVLGALLGLALGPKVAVLQPIGEVFVRLLRMLVVPVVVLTLLAGFSAPSPAGIGKVGLKAAGWFLGFSIVATVTGLSLAIWFHPGVGLPIPTAVEKTEAVRLTAREFMLGVIPENVIAAVVKGDLLAVVFFTILLGLAIASLRRSSPDAASVESLHRILETLRRAVSVIQHWVMAYAPVATLALVAITFGEARAGVMLQFARAITAVYAAHAFIGLLCLLVMRVAGVRPIQFLRGAKEPLLTALVTGSSAAALPLEIEAAAKRLYLDSRASSFVLSLGAGVHKIGTAAHLAVMVIFAANAVGMQADLTQYAMLGLLVLAGAVGTPPISGGAYVALGFIFEQAGLPLSLIGVLLGIPLLAKFSTPINSLGRLTVAALVIPAKEFVPPLDDSI